MGALPQPIPCPAGCCSCQTDGGQRRCSQCKTSADLAKRLLIFPTHLKPLSQGEQLLAEGSSAACPTWSPAVVVVQGSVRSQAQIN